MNGYSDDFNDLTSKLFNSIKIEQFPEKEKEEKVIIKVYLDTNATYILELDDNMNYYVIKGSHLYKKEFKQGFFREKIFLVNLGHIENIELICNKTKESNHESNIFRH